MDKKFQKLQAKWYEKLKKEGFEDIEYPDGRMKVTGNIVNRTGRQEDRKFHNESRSPSRRYVPKYDAGSTDYARQTGGSNVWLRAKQDYYYYANQFLHSHEFANPFEKAVWEYHSNGMGMREIAGTLKKLKLARFGKKSPFHQTRLVVERLRKLMLEKYLVKS